MVGVRMFPVWPHLDTGNDEPELLRGDSKPRLQSGDQECPQSPTKEVAAEKLYGSRHELNITMQWMET